LRVALDVPKGIEGLAGRPHPVVQLILIADDDPSVRELAGAAAQAPGVRDRPPAASAEEALARVAAEPDRPGLQDMNFSRATSGEEGLELLAEIRRRCGRSCRWS
jgi:two-component system, NtrC family, response regulator